MVFEAVVYKRIQKLNTKKVKLIILSALLKHRTHNTVRSILLELNRLLHKKNK